MRCAVLMLVTLMLLGGCCTKRRVVRTVPAALPPVAAPATAEFPEPADNEPAVEPLPLVDECPGGT